MFRGPSWVDHSWRPALLFRPKTSEPRRARGRSTLPAPLPDWPRKTPKSFSLPVGGDRSFRHPPLSFLPLPAFRWRRGLPSRSPFDNAPRVRVGEVKNSVTSLWITGILGTTADCIVTIAIRDSRDSLSVLLRDPDNGRIGPSSRVRRPSRFVPPAGSAPAAR